MSAAAPSTALAGAAERSLPHEQAWSTRRSFPIRNYLAVLIPGGVLVTVSVTVPGVLPAVFGAT